MGRRETDTLVYELRSEYENRGIRQAQRGMNELGDDIEGVSRDTRDAGNEAEQAESKFKNFASNALAAFAGFAGAQMFAPVIESLGNVTSEVFGWSDAMNQFEATTGQAGGEFKDVAQAIYQANWGENIDDVVVSMGEVHNITQTTGDDLELLTTQALIMRDAFDYDIGESIRAADTAAVNFGENTADVMDMITTVAQRTGDPMDDLLDTVNEYSVQFADAGFSAQGMFAILQSGVDAGAFNFDKVADAVKEFNIRLLDGSDTSEDAWTQIIDLAEASGEPIRTFVDGQLVAFESTQDLWQAVEDGSFTGAQAMNQAIGVLEGIEDPLLRNQIGVQLFGTQWEDMGADVILAMNDMQDGLGEFEDSTMRAGDVLSRGIGPALQGLKRQLITGLGNALEPFIMFLIGVAIPAIGEFGGWIADNVLPAVQDLGQQALPVLRKALDKVVDAVEPIVEQMGEWVESITAFIDENPKVLEFLKYFAIGIGVLTGAFLLYNIIAGIAAGITTVLAIGMAILTSPITLIILALAALGAAYATNLFGFRDAVDSVANAIKPILESIVSWFEGLIAVFQSGGLEGAFNYVKDTVITAIQGIPDFLATVPDLIITALTGLDSILGTNLAAPFTNIIDQVKNLFSGEGEGGLGTKLKTLGADIIGWLVALPGELLTALLTPFEGVISDILAFFGVDNPDGIAHTLVNLPAQISGWLGTLATDLVNFLYTPFEVVINDIAAMLSGEDSVIGSALNTLISTFSTIWTAISPFIDALKTGIQTAFDWIKTNGIDWLTNAITFLITTFWGIWTAVSPYIDTLKTNIQTAFNFIKDNVIQPVIDIIGDLVGGFTGIWDLIGGTLNTLKDSVGGVFNAMIAPIQAVINKIGEIFGKVEEAASAIASLNPLSGSGEIGAEVNADGTITVAMEGVGSINVTPEQYQQILDTAAAHGGTFGQQSGTHWTGSGPLDGIAGFHHFQEAVVPAHGLMVTPSPGGLMLSGSLGGGGGNVQYITNYNTLPNAILSTDSLAKNLAQFNSDQAPD